MRIHHIALRSFDPARLAAFYVDVLGLRVIRRQPHGIWLGVDHVVLMIESMAAGEPPPDPTSMRLLAFAFTAQERPAFRARLDAHGVAVEGRTDFTWYFRDPEGRRLGVSTYDFGAAFDITRKMGDD